MASWNPLNNVDGVVLSVLVYVYFFYVFVYAVVFVSGTDMWPSHPVLDKLYPLRIDSTSSRSTDKISFEAIASNLPWFTAFVVQHSIMARPAFKKKLVGFIPAYLERSVFVLAASICLHKMILTWTPINYVVFNLTGTLGKVVQLVGVAGWALVLLATFNIDHFDLFGLRQGFMGAAYTAPEWTERYLYGVVRHPLMSGFFIAFWATPHMTFGHLFFAVGATAYILLVGTVLEERDLKKHNSGYVDYAQRVPAFCPVFGRKKNKRD